MGRKALISLTLALNMAFFGVACSSTRGEEGEVDRRPGGSGDLVTITGCLTGTADGRFAVTATPDEAVALAERAVSDERTTHSYVLIGGSDLQSHIGKRVEVTGTIVGADQSLDHDAKSRTEAAPTNRGETPTVATNEEVEVEARQLQVQQVRPLAAGCD